MTPEERAAELLPCPWGPQKCHGDCQVCQRRPAVAAALAEAARHGSFSPPCGHGAWIIYNDEREWCGWCELKAEAAALRKQLENWKQVAFEADQAKGCLEEKVSELEAYNQVLLESQGQFRSDLQAARVEGLREAKQVAYKNSGYCKHKTFDVCRRCFSDAIDAEIAALERGKG